MKSSNRRQTNFVKLSTRKCKACWKCVNSCPEKVIGKVGFLWHRHAVIDYAEGCVGCLKCTKVCPAKAFSPFSEK